MIKKIKSFLGIKQTQQSETDFSNFFHTASSGQKKKLLLEVVRDANKDQRELIKAYNKIHSNPA